MSPLKTVSSVRRFLGAVGFYGKFIAGFSEIAAPLYKLNKKGTRRKFLIFTDAQLKNGIPQPISFYSHKFRGHELIYSIIEKKYLAIIMETEQFDYCIYCQQNRELKFFHVKGKENAMADWLSRDTYNTEVAVVDVYGVLNGIPNYEKSMLNCPVWKNIYKRALITDSKVEESDGTYFISKFTRYIVKVIPDLIPTRKGRMVKQIVIPPVLRDTILKRLCVDFVGPLTLSRNRNRYLPVFINAFTRIWEDNIGAVVAAYNSAVHSALGESPHYMLFGHDAVNHDVSDKDVSEFMETVRKFLAENYDERVKKYKTQTVRIFETGDLVLLAVPKRK
ncbi:K02A2.6-like, partial [Cordylochernes scorpioides]